MRNIYGLRGNVKTRWGRDKLGAGLGEAGYGGAERTCGMRGSGAASVVVTGS